MGKIKDTDLLLINRGGTDYKSAVEELSIPKKTSELDNDANFITLADVPPAPDGGIPEAPTDGEQYARKNSAWAIVEIPEGFSGDYNDLTNQPPIPTDNAELTNGANYITIDQVPEPELEGALIFRGDVKNFVELEFLNDTAAVGDLYYNEDDNHLYAKGESGWHKVGQVSDVDLDGYATEEWVEAKGYITADALPQETTVADLPALPA